MLIIGKIVGFHGLKGEVKIPFSERLINNLSVLKELYVFTSKKDFELLEIDNFRLHKGNVLLKFKRYPDKNSVEHLKGALLKQHKENLAPLGTEEYFINDLITLDAYDLEGNLLGKINAVFTEEAPDDIIEIKTPDNKLKLIPFVEELVPIVDIPNKKIVINNIPGLLEDEV